MVLSEDEGATGHGHSLFHWEGGMGMGLSRARQGQKIEGLILQRIIAMLEDEETPNGDVFKAAALFCEHFRDESEKQAQDVEVKFVE